MVKEVTLVHGTMEKLAHSRAKIAPAIRAQSAPVIGGAPEPGQLRRRGLCCTGLVIIRLYWSGFPWVFKISDFFFEIF